MPSKKEPAAKVTAHQRRVSRRAWKPTRLNSWRSSQQSPPVRFSRPIRACEFATIKTRLRLALAVRLCSKTISCARSSCISITKEFLNASFTHAVLLLMEFSKPTITPRNIAKPTPPSRCANACVHALLHCRRLQRLVRHGERRARICHEVLHSRRRIRPGRQQHAVFFIQDGIKFPDLIHAVKPEPHNEIPQAQSAHDTFWDFVSLSTEATHMVMWVMSDRALPRSLRMMQVLAYIPSA